MKKKFFLNFITIDNNSVNQRIDNFLFKKIKYLSRNKIYSLIRKGNIRINKKRISHKYKLKLFDVVRLPLIRLNSLNKKIYISKNNILKFKNMIIHEDKFLLVFNKPYGISVHGGTNINFNIIDILRNEIYNNYYLELIHRIDKNSSGILLIAKNRIVLCKLQQDFKNHNIIKKYFILVHGNWPKNIKLIKNFISKKKYNNFFIYKKKFSQTNFKILKYINNYTLLSVQTLTGRNHQIRLHTSNLGFPIIFDNIYGNKYLDKILFSKIKISRLFLHAYFISFFHPILKIKKEICINLDKKLLLILNKINNLNY